MKPKPLRTLGTFATDRPAELSRQLSQLEQNVDDAFRSQADSSLPPLTPTNLKFAAYTATIGELVLVDTSTVSAMVMLPVATPQNAGRMLAIARLSAANVLTVKPPSGKVNNAASLALTAAVRLFFLVSDGVAWWSTA